MDRMINILIILILMFCFYANNQSALYGQDDNVAKIVVYEPFALERSIEYIECNLQLNENGRKGKELQLYVQDINTGQNTVCQIYKDDYFPEEKIRAVSIIFPISISANERKTFNVKYGSPHVSDKSNLSIQGQGFDLKIENQFYLADLTKSAESEGKNHESGQLRELFIKMGFNQRLFRGQNRIHWAPNFQKKDVQHYQTIAGWEKPKTYNLFKGPYLVFSERCDLAPGNPEILLSASYKFYADLPYFIFFSSMEFIENSWLTLLRNDEMTMDSLFTNVACERISGEIIDLPFKQRYELLEKNPIENEAPWLCFYNRDKGYGYASIRIMYDIRDRLGQPSPTYLAHTKISDGSGGGKYWNRRLIHDHPTFVAKGSRYTEQNAYLVFKLAEGDKFKEIKYWADRLRNPVLVEVFIASDNY